MFTNKGMPANLGGQSPERPGSQSAAGVENRTAADRTGDGGPAAKGTGRSPQPRSQRADRAGEGQSREGRNAAGAAATVDATGGGAAAENTALDSIQSKCCAQPGPAETQTAKMGDLGSSRERRTLRWNARQALWSASTLKAVRCCGRQLGYGKGMVTVKKSGVSAGYGNLGVCGSPWSCPRCSAVIAAHRSSEIGNAVAACQANGGDVAMMTLTLRHNAGDDIEQLWEGLSAGWRETFGSTAYTGRKGCWRTNRNGSERWQAGKIGDRDRFNIAGTTRAVECTFGRPELGGNGWHLHAHVLLYSATKFSDLLDRAGVARLLMLDRPATDAESRMVALTLIGSRFFDRWQRGVVKAGLPSPEGGGFDLRYVQDEGADFIGRYLAKSTLDVAAKVGAEVGGGRNTKVSRVERNVTPFEMLDDLTRRAEAPKLGFRTPRHWDWLELPEGGSGVVDLDTGEITEVTAPGEWSRWHAWERASKGRKQILWSLCIKEPTTSRELAWNAILDARGRDVTDEEFAETELDGAVVAAISKEGWYNRMVWHPSWITDLLDAVEDATDDQDAADTAAAWLDYRGVERYTLEEVTDLAYTPDEYLAPVDEGDVLF